MRKTLNSSSKIVKIPIKSKLVVKEEEKEPDKFNNEFKCTKCNKVFPVDNSIQGIQNFGMILMTHWENECGKIVEKQADQDQEMLVEDNHEVDNDIEVGQLSEKVEADLKMPLETSKSQGRKHKPSSKPSFGKHENKNACTECEETFKLKKSLKIHTLMVHNGWKCSKCGKSFKN